LLEFDVSRYFSVGPPIIGKGLTAVSSKLCRPIFFRGTGIMGRVLVVLNGWKSRPFAPIEAVPNGFGPGTCGGRQLEGMPWRVAKSGLPGYQGGC
jgi:hypothetical protein